MWKFNNYITCDTTFDLLYSPLVTDGNNKPVHVRMIHTAWTLFGIFSTLNDD